MHNHPSGTTQASAADHVLTDRLKEALGFADVAVLDHIVVGGTEALSFAERGYLYTRHHPFEPGYVAGFFKPDRELGRDRSVPVDDARQRRARYSELSRGFGERGA